MPTYRTILTDTGRALEAASHVSGTPIVLTEMAVGDGNGNPVTPNPAQTILARERFRADINQLSQDAADPTRFVAELVVPVAAGGFTIREVGLFTSDGDLFAVANVPDTYKPTTGEGAFSDTVVRMVFLLANASVVNLVIDPNVTVATRTWVINNVSAETVLPGGLTGQVLRKRSNADGDTEWGDPSAAVNISVATREESQTLAASQTLVDLSTLSTDGLAVYIEGVRLRSDQFVINSPTQISLSATYMDGTKVTLVQNEQTGYTDLLQRALNLSDVPDKAVARANLGIPSAISTATINWSQLAGVPAFASRWPSFAEVTDKPATYPPSAHTHTFAQITDPPATATRWPTWGEVTGKPSTFTPSSHLHVIGDITGLQSALDAKAPLASPTFTGTVRAPTFQTTSSRQVKHEIAPSPHGLAEVLRLSPGVFRFLPEFDADQRQHVGLIAEDVAEVVPQAVGAADGEVPGIDYAQLVPVLIAAIHELQARLQAVEARG